MKFDHEWREKPALGEDVFITATTFQDQVETVPAILNPIGREVYAASLDPDAEDVYEVAVGMLAECHTIVGDLSGTYRHMKIWRNGPEGGGNEVLQEFDLDEIICISPTEKATILIDVPFWEKDGMFT